MPAKKISRRTQTTRLRATKDDYVWCRTFGHDWEEWHTTHQPEFGYYESVYCPRCSTERLFTINLLGDVMGRRYIYPDDYRLGFKVKRADARRELRKRGWWSGEARTDAAKMASRRAAKDAA